jgi:hypothetical protein
MGPVLRVFAVVAIIVSAVAGGLSLVVQLGLISLPLLPFVAITVVGITLGVIAFFLTMDHSQKSMAHPRAHQIDLQTTAQNTTAARSLEDMCNDIANKHYGKAYPEYEEIDVIPNKGGQRVKWSVLPDDQKWKLFQAGSKGTGGKQAVAEIQRLLDLGKPLSAPEIQKIMKKRLCTPGKVSTVHGAGHAQRCAALIFVLHELYSKTFQLQPLSPKELTALQIAAMLHDSGRQGDGSDIWGEISAQNTESYLRQAGFAEDLCKRAGDAIRNKDRPLQQLLRQPAYDVFAILLHEADCLEYMRVRGGHSFDANHLFVTHLPLAKNASNEMRQALSDAIVAGEKKFIQHSSGFGIDYKAFDEYARKIFNEKILPDEACGKALNLVFDLATQTPQLTKKMNMSLPTPIEQLQNVKSEKINWSASAEACRLLLKQLGKDAANESNEDAICLGRNVESLLICCDACARGHVWFAKLQDFQRGMFSQTYTFSDGTKSYVFKPIIPLDKPNACDMSRRYGTSYFTQFARELAPGQLNAFMVDLGKSFGIQIPNLHVKTHSGVIGGQVGTVMETAHGTSMAHQRSSNFYNKPDFRQQETWLQLMDCLLGQYDRHSGNVFWDGNDITAIDQDISFPDPKLRLSAQFTDRHGIHDVTEQMRQYAQAVDMVNQVPLRLYRKHSEGGRAVDGLAGAWNYCMPWVIDEDMRTLIMAIKSETFRQFLETTGLTAGQINAAVARLGSMQTHITAGRVRIIAPNAWGSDLLNECTSWNSYFMWH